MRTTFPLGEAHLWEIGEITDPKQRGHLADVLEALSDYQYLLGHITIAKTGVRGRDGTGQGEGSISGSLPLVRATMGQVLEASRAATARSL